LPRKKPGFPLQFASQIPLQSLARHHFRQRLRLAGSDEEAPALPEKYNIQVKGKNSLLIPNS
jgi:hypothetical protein